MDITVNKAETQPILQRCLNNHPLLWTNLSDENNIEESYVCRGCKNIFSCRSKKWLCKECKYYVCPLCLPYQEPVIPGECENHHKMIWKIDAKIKETFICSVCGIILPQKAGAWTCEICKYILCSYCSKSMKCKKDHLMLWIREKPFHLNSEFFYCDLCSTKSAYLDGVWHCNICDYDVCGECSVKVAKIEVNDWLKDKRINNISKTKEFICQICLEDNVSTVLLPCGHVLCSDCSGTITICPFDRIKCTEKKKLIFS